MAVRRIPSPPRTFKGRRYLGAPRVRRRKPGLGKRIAAQRKRAFTPYVDPTRPPSGTYDPALDAQERASQRGLSDLTQDTELGGERSLSDYLLGQGNLTRQRDEGLSDLLRRRQGVALDYQRLGNRQAEQSRVAGVRGGALIQAMQKRAANQQRDLEPIGIAETRLKADTDRRLGALSIDYQRGGQDRTSALARAQREGGFFGQDIGAQRWFQAKASGATLPQGPANEYTRYGTTFRLSGAGNKRRYTLPTGRQLSRRQWLRYVRANRRRR